MTSLFSCMSSSHSWYLDNNRSIDVTIFAGCVHFDKPGQIEGENNNVFLVLFYKDSSSEKARSHRFFCLQDVYFFFFVHPNFRMTCGKLYRDKSTLLLAEFGFKNLCKLPTKFNTQTANKNTSIFWKDFLEIFFIPHIHTRRIQIHMTIIWNTLCTRKSYSSYNLSWLAMDIVVIFPVTHWTGNYNYYGWLSTRIW